MYLHAKFHPRNSFILHQFPASSVSEGLESSPGNYFLECCRAVLSWPSEWSEYQHGDSLSMLVSVCEKKKNRNVTNLENTAQAATE